MDSVAGARVAGFDGALRNPENKISVRPDVQPAVYISKFLATRSPAQRRQRLIGAETRARAAIRPTATRTGVIPKRPLNVASTGEPTQRLSGARLR